MPLSQAQIEAISKLPDGSGILSTVEADIEAATASSASKMNALVRENVEKKSAVRNYVQQLEAIGFDPTKPLKNQFEELQEKTKGELSKGMKPTSEVDALAKKIERFEKALADSAAREESLKQQNRREKAAATFSPILPDHFGKASSLILKNAIADGIITIDENGQPGVKGADGEFYTGDAAINELKKIHADLVITKQKPGSGNTAGRGGGTSQGKAITREEFNAMAMDQQMELVTKQGAVWNAEQNAYVTTK
jgi:ribosomal protein S16